MFPIYGYLVIRIAIWTWSYISLIEKFLSLLIAFNVISIYFLQLIWYRLILIGLFKLLGIIKTNKKVPTEAEDDDGKFEGGSFKSGLFCQDG